jgi:hypothetical protein
VASRKKIIPKSSESLKPEIIEQTLPVRPKSLVFISHDSRDADIAEAFANLLSDVSAGTLKSFRSSDKKANTGIEFGAEWYTSIMSQLGDATDVVALLTARSIDRPWILYEAGVAKGKLETTVLGLALGVPLDRVSTGPFGQFQNCGDDEDSLTKLVMQLLQRNPDAAPREEAVRLQVKLFIQTLANIPAVKAKKHNIDASNEEQNVAKLFEEVKAMVRELPERVDDKVRNASRRISGKFPRKLHPKLIEELLFRSFDFPHRAAKPAGLLVVLSLIKDNSSWLYEIGMEIYRAMINSDRLQLQGAHRRLRACRDIMQNSGISREIYRGIDEEEMFMTNSYLSDFLDNYTLEYIKTMPIRKRYSVHGEAVDKTAQLES